MREDRMWRFLLDEPYGPSPTTAMTNVLEGSQLSPEQILAREALQNCADARDRMKNQAVKVEFRNQVLTGAAKAEFINALSIHEFVAPRIYNFADSPDYPKDGFLNSLGDPNKTLKTLSIEDFNTHGLGGQWDRRGPDNHFYKLVFSFGNEDKAANGESTQGSFGYGKTVYPNSSRVRMIVVYSAFAETDYTQGHHARLIGLAYFPPHEYGENAQEFTGHAYFGVPNPENSQKLIPFHNEDAHEMANALGFELRDQGQLGTSIMIVDSYLEIPEIRRAIEEFWWPRLLSKGDSERLEVEFFDSGNPLDPPRPSKNKDARPFVEIYNDLISGTDDPPSLQIFTPNKLDGLDLGRGILKRLEVPADADPKTTCKYTNTVALMRIPGMVIGYHKFGSDSYEPCIGIFKISSPEVDSIVKLAEPPAHHLLDPQQSRLRRRKGDQGRRVVAAILSRIEAQFRNFQRKQEPPLPQGGARFDLLEKLLGNFFRIEGSSPSPPPRPDPRPVKIEFVSVDRKNNGGTIVDSAEIRLSIQPEHDQGMARCRFSARLNVLGDTNRRHIGSMECRLYNSDGRRVAVGREPCVAIEIQKGRPEKFLVEAIVRPDATTE